MNSGADPVWPHPEQFEPMAQVEGDDFAKFLDLGDIDFDNFPLLEPEAGAGQDGRHIPQQQQQPSAEGATNTAAALRESIPPHAQEAYRQQQLAQRQQFQNQQQQAIINGMQHHPPNHMSSGPGIPQNQRNGYPHQQNAQYEGSQHYQGAQKMGFVPRRHAVPPTPNSIDMHGDLEKVMSGVNPQTRAMLEQQYQMGNIDPSSFSPLVSPAVTPQETPANYPFPPEFPQPGSYMSPLTSPMLAAQQQQQQQQRGNYSSSNTSVVDPDSRTAENSVVTSPADYNVDIMTDVQLGTPQMGNQQSPSNEPPRKLRPGRKTAPAAPRSTVSGTAAGTRIRQSPISKPAHHTQRHRGSISIANVPNDFSDLIDSLQAQTSAPHLQRAKTGSPAGGRPLPARNLTRQAAAPARARKRRTGPRGDSRRGSSASDADSISPEPLSEALMGPPPPPTTALGARSGSASPNTALQQSYTPHERHPGGVLGDGVVATPASLMRLQQERQKRQQPANGAGPTSASSTSTAPTGDLGLMEDLSLPEAATDASPHPHPANLDTAAANAHTTPRPGTAGGSTHATPRGGAPLSAGATAASSTRPSPRLAGSSTSPSIAADKKDGGKGGRSAAGKKRNSSGSALVSPALRPKISPSIKPLLPEGVAMTDETHALLLASKSNYQNILEGTHLPGVHYPETLSTNLTSKRTSHKIAEQGRRNRINTALAEMQALLPPGASTAKASPEAASTSPAPSSAQQQSNSKAATVESAIDYIKALKHENAALRRRLAASEAGSSASDSERSASAPDPASKGDEVKAR